MYLPTLRLPFLGDDYVFLDETRTSTFAQLWSRAHIEFGWWRPWSRELHFWVLQHLAGPSPIAFRLVSLGLWLSSLSILGSVFRRLANEAVAVIAIAGLAALGLWGATLIWIAGAQDLWLVFFLALTLRLAQSSRWPLALAPYAAALLSKELAAIIPVLLAALWLVAERRRAAEVAWRLAPFVALTFAWVLAHPILLTRLAHPKLGILSAEAPLPQWQIGLKTAQSLLNVDQVGGALVPSPLILVALALGALLLAAAIFVAGRAPSAPLDATHSRRVFATGAIWAATGWLALFLPSVGWHAYYGCLGAIGAWLVLAMWLRQDRGFAIFVVLALGGLRLVNTSSTSFDWGSEWYQRRAGDLLDRVHTQLLALHPGLPAHSRIFFSGLPNNIGVIAGDSPAPRVWYHDATLQGGFYSYYRPRDPHAPAGSDFFFRYEPVHGLHEVRLGPEDAGRELAHDPGWTIDHESLANVLVLAGDPARAADEYEKIGQLPDRGDALVAAATCHELAGDAAASHALIERAAQRLGRPIAVVSDSVGALRARVTAAMRAPER
jgi:hypothetical protein